MINEKQVTVEHVNKRDTRLFVDKNSLLVSIPEKLQRLKKAYTQLLQASKRKIEQKDFSQISNILGIAESEPSKWKEAECLSYMKYETEMMKSHLARIREENDILSKKLDSFDSRIENDLQISEQEILNIQKDFDSRMLFDGITNYEVTAMLHNSVRVYFGIVDVIIHLSTIL